MKSYLYYFGRLLQAAGMGIVLIGIFLSIEQGVRETGTGGFQSMAIEVKYLGAGGVLFMIGLLLDRATRK